MRHYETILDDSPSASAQRLIRCPIAKIRAVKKQHKWAAAYQKRAEWEPEDYENEDQRLRAELEAILAKRQQQ
jgi:hypothetical protein